MARQNKETVRESSSPQKPYTVEAPTNEIDLESMIVAGVIQTVIKPFKKRKRKPNPKARY
jgi:hypothetical protein